VVVTSEGRAMERETVAALRRCREAWASFSLALVLLMQRGDWLPEDMLAAVARYRDLEPLIVALNGEGGVAAIRPTLPTVARVLGIAGDLSDAQILDAAADFFDGLTKEYERARLAGLAA
jgi:hypothetical protein